MKTSTFNEKLIQVFNMLYLNETSSNFSIYPFIQHMMQDIKGYPCKKCRFQISIFLGPLYTLIP